MLMISNLDFKLVNAITLRREFTTFFLWVAIYILLYSSIICFISDNGIGIYNGLFHSTAITPSPQGGGALSPIPPPFPPGRLPLYCLSSEGLQGGS
jgi:hypothetical protein